MLNEALNGKFLSGKDVGNNAIVGIEIEWTDQDENAISNTLWNRTKKYAELHTDGSYYINKTGYESGFITQDICQEKALNGRRSHLGIFANFFVESDFALDRVSLTEMQQQIDPDSTNLAPLVQYAYHDEGIADNIGKYFTRIFHEPISFYDFNGKLGYVLSDPVDNAPIRGRSLGSEFIEKIRSVPKIWDQGLGLRSVLGLLLRVFASDCSILIIDEPEVFLHPPQAIALGEVLAEIARDYDKQIFLATHDRNLINGLMRSGRSNVAIQRLNKIGDDRKIQSIRLDDITKVKNQSIMRYSPILDSLFTKFTVLVENETDAYFYSESISHFLDVNKDDLRFTNLSIDDILFLEVSGKNNLPKVAELASSLGSRVTIVADFDVFDDFCESKDPLVQRMYLGVNEEYSIDYPDDPQKIFDKYIPMAAERCSGSREKKNVENFIKDISKNGINMLDDSVLQPMKDFMEEFDNIGICVPQVGVLEGFDRGLFTEKGKQEWLHNAFNEGVHSKSEAQEFSKRILDSLFRSGRNFSNS
jgi:putative uncharacterized protein (fragment)